MKQWSCTVGRPLELVKSQDSYFICHHAVPPSSVHSIWTFAVPWTAPPQMELVPFKTRRNVALTIPTDTVFIARSEMVTIEGEGARKASVWPR